MLIIFKKDDIIHLLEKLSKNLTLPKTVVNFIKTNTKNYGSCRMFLYNEFVIYN